MAEGPSASAVTAAGAIDAPFDFSSCAKGLQIVHYTYLRLCPLVFAARPSSSPHKALHRPAHRMLVSTALQTRVVYYNSWEKLYAFTKPQHCHLGWSVDRSGPVRQAQIGHSLARVAKRVKVV
jgi:hypothetical protein